MTLDRLIAIALWVGSVIVAGFTSSYVRGEWIRHGNEHAFIENYNWQQHANEHEVLRTLIQIEMKRQQQGIAQPR